MAKSTKGHNPVNISRNLLKSKSGHLNFNPKPYTKYQNPSSSGSQDIMLTRYLWPSRKRGITLPSRSDQKKICVRLFFVLMLHIKIQVPSSRGFLVLQLTILLY